MVICSILKKTKTEYGNPVKIINWKGSIFPKEIEFIKKEGNCFIYSFKNLNNIELYQKGNLIIAGMSNFKFFKIKNTFYDFKNEDFYIEVELTDLIKFVKKTFNIKMKNYGNIDTEFSIYKLNIETARIKIFLKPFKVLIEVYYFYSTVFDKEKLLDFISNFFKVYYNVKNVVIEEKNIEDSKNNSEFSGRSRIPFGFNN